MILHGFVLSMGFTDNKRKYTNTTGHLRALETPKSCRHVLCAGSGGAGCAHCGGIKVRGRAQHTTHPPEMELCAAAPPASTCQVGHHVYKLCWQWLRSRLHVCLFSSGGNKHLVAMLHLVVKFSITDIT